MRVRARTSYTDIIPGLSFAYFEHEKKKIRAAASVLLIQSALCVIRCALLVLVFLL